MKAALSLSSARTVSENASAVLSKSSSSARASRLPPEPASGAAHFKKRGAAAFATRAPVLIIPPIAGRQCGVVACNRSVCAENNLRSLLAACAVRTVCEAYGERTMSAGVPAVPEIRERQPLFLCWGNSDEKAGFLRAGKIFKKEAGGSIPRPRWRPLLSARRRLPCSAVPRCPPPLSPRRARCP